MAQMIDFLFGSAQRLKHPEAAAGTRQTQVTIFSSQLQRYSNRNLHRTPVLAGDVPARSTA